MHFMHPSTKKKRARLIRELTDAVIEWNNVATYDELGPAEKRLQKVSRKLERHMDNYGEEHPWEEGVL